MVCETLSDSMDGVTVLGGVTTMFSCSGSVSSVADGVTDTGGGTAGDVVWGEVLCSGADSVSVCGSV